jgi:hypothetical protein
MKQTLSPVPATADPLRDFLSTLPREATILGAKGYQSPDHSVTHLAYLLNGVVVKASFSTKGGAA